MKEGGGGVLKGDLGYMKKRGGGLKIFPSD